MFMIGLWQKIVFDDFLPLFLGRTFFRKNIGTYAGYKSNINPAINNEFMTSGYRIGHTIVNSPIKQVNNNEETVR